MSWLMGSCGPEPQMEKRVTRDVARRWRRLEDVARREGLEEGYLRSAVAGETEFPPRKTEPLICVRLRTDDEVVLVDGYQRLEAKRGNEVRVREVEADTVLEALRLRFEYNMEDRSLTRIEAVGLALGLRIGGFEAWFARQYVPRLRMTDFEVGPCILKSLGRVSDLVFAAHDELPPFPRLVKLHLIQYNRPLRPFYQRYVKPVNYFAPSKPPLDRLCPRLVPPRSSSQATLQEQEQQEQEQEEECTAEALLCAAKNSENDDAWLCAQDAYRHAWRKCHVQPPTLEPDAVVSLVEGTRSVQPETLNLLAGVLNARSTNVVVAGVVEPDDLAVCADTILESVGWISASGDVLEHGLLYDVSRIVVFLKHALSGDQTHWTILVAEPPEERFVHLDARPNVHADATAHVAKFREILRAYAEVCGVETTVESWRVQQAAKLPRVVPSASLDAGLDVALFAAALSLNAALPVDAFFDVNRMLRARSNLAAYLHGGLDPRSLLRLPEKKRTPQTAVTPLVPPTPPTGEYCATLVVDEVATTPARDKLLGDAAGEEKDDAIQLGDDDSVRENCREHAHDNEQDEEEDDSNDDDDVVESFLKKADESEIDDRISAVAILLRRNLQNASPSQKRKALRELVAMVGDLGDTATVEKMNRLLAVGRAASLPSNSESWRVVKGLENIQTLLDPRVYSIVKSQLGSASKLFCWLDDGQPHPWTVTGRSTAGTRSRGLFYVGQETLAKTATIGFYDGVQLGPTVAERPGKYVKSLFTLPRVEEWPPSVRDAWSEQGRHSRSAAVEVFVDGKPGVCGGMHKMNDHLHYNVAILDDGVCRVVATEIQPGSELFSQDCCSLLPPPPKKRKQHTETKQ